MFCGYDFFCCFYALNGLKIKLRKKYKIQERSEEFKYNHIEEN